MVRINKDHKQVRKFRQASTLNDVEGSRQDLMSFPSDLILYVLLFMHL